MTNCYDDGTFTDKLPVVACSTHRSDCERKKTYARGEIFHRGGIKGAGRLRRGTRFITFQSESITGWT